MISTQVEWYDPALRDRDTHLVVDAATAPKVLAALNADPARQMRLAEGAAKVRRSLVCPDCIADYVRRLAEAVRLQTGADAVLDDAAFLRNLVAGVPGACDAFVDETGGSLCAFLATNPKAPREAEGDDDDDSNATVVRPTDPVDLVPDEVWDAELEDRLNSL